MLDRKAYLISASLGPVSDRSRRYLDGYLDAWATKGAPDHVWFEDIFPAMGRLKRSFAGLAGCDVVVMLRLQNERMKGALLPSAGEYFKHYGLTSEKLALAKPDAIVMHPGPMNRGVEISSEIADGSRSLILDQVTNGVAVRMAVLYLLAGGSPAEPVEEKPKKQKRERK